MIDIEKFIEWIKDADDDKIKKIESICKEEIAKRSLERLKTGSVGWYGAGV